MPHQNPKAQARRRASLVAVLAALLVAVLAPVPAAAEPCALDSCNNDCRGGCGVSYALQHSSIGYSPAQGRIELQGTRFATTCSGGVNCERAVPPLRFWAFDDYRSANSGCADPVALQWMFNAALDMGLPQPPGNWYLYQANWAGPAVPGPGRVDGCISAVASPATVLEMSWADEFSGEGTADHDAWYILAAVSEAPFDFDRIDGATTLGGSGPASLRPVSVPDVALAGLVCPDNGSTLEVLRSPLAANLADVTVELSDSAPGYLTDYGRDDPGLPLIAGLQMVYLEGGAAPTTSLGNWQPALDPIDPTLAARVLPWAAAPRMTVSVPSDPFGPPLWLAARIVYTDASVNGQLEPGPLVSAPRLVSPTGKSCGPVVVSSQPGCVAIEPRLSADPRVQCPGMRLLLDGSASTMTGLGGGGCSDPPSYRWWRNSEVIAGFASRDQIAVTTTTTATYSLDVACVECNSVDRTAIEVEVAPPDAVYPVGNDLRVVRQGDDLVFTWEDTGSAWYALRRYDTRRLEIPSSRVVQASRSAGHRAVGAALASGRLFGYRALAISCNGALQP